VAEIPLPDCCPTPGVTCSPYCHQWPRFFFLEPVSGFVGVPGPTEPFIDALNVSGLQLVIHFASWYDRVVQLTVGGITGTFFYDLSPFTGATGSGWQVALTLQSPGTPPPTGFAAVVYYRAYLSDEPNSTAYADTCCNDYTLPFYHLDVAPGYRNPFAQVAPSVSVTAVDPCTRSQYYCPNPDTPNGAMLPDVLHVTFADLGGCAVLDGLSVAVPLLRFLTPDVIQNPDGCGFWQVDYQIPGCSILCPADHNTPHQAYLGITLAWEAYWFVMEGGTGAGCNGFPTGLANNITLHVQNSPLGENFCPGLCGGILSGSTLSCSPLLFEGVMEFVSDLQMVFGGSFGVPAFTGCSVSVGGKASVTITE
jgi:hypothetical protein